MRVYMHVSAGALRVQKRASEPLTVVSPLLWVLDTNVGPLQEQQALYTTELPPQTPSC